MHRRVAIVVGVLAVVAAGGAAFRWWRTKDLSRVERGYRVAQEKGCFACHGPGGLRGMANPGYGLEEVPPFAGGLITMYASDEREIREWIADGLTQRVRADPQQMKLRENALIRMPAFRDLLSARELDDLVAFVKAVSDFESPPAGPASDGREVAHRLGCFNCHGPQGRGSSPNARALKGYIPSWDGADFAELCRDEAEVKEWILDGRPRRLAENRAARFFMDRQPIQMPGYRGHIGDKDLESLLAYIRWVREHPY
jgi:mono/diheme cytochrome c family protein